MDRDNDRSERTRDFRSRRRETGFFDRYLSFDFKHEPVGSLGKVLLWMFVFLPVIYGLFYGSSLPGSNGFHRFFSGLGSIGNKVTVETLEESKPEIDRAYLERVRRDRSTVDQINDRR